jgi:hypothetical protein
MPMPNTDLSECSGFRWFLVTYTRGQENRQLEPYGMEIEDDVVVAQERIGPKRRIVTV